MDNLTLDTVNFCKSFYSRVFSLPTRNAQVNGVGMRVSDVQLFRFNSDSGDFEVPILSILLLFSPGVMVLALYRSHGTIQQSARC